MGRFTAALTVVSVALGCGRLSFDARSDARSGATDSEGIDARGADAPTGPFCDSQPSATFCADFTHGSAGWSMSEMINASYVIDPTGGPTPLSGALVVTTNVGGGPAEASMLVGSPVPTTAFAYSFDARIDVTGVGFPALALVVFDGATSSHGVEYVYNSGAGLTNIEEIVDPDVGTTTFTNSAAPGFAPNEWHRVSVAISIGTMWTVVVKVDGLQSTNFNLADTTNGIVAFSVGVPYLGDTSSPWVIRVSNVVLDVQ